MDAPAGDADLAMRTSVWHYAAFKRLLERLAPLGCPFGRTGLRQRPGVARARLDGAVQGRASSSQRLTGSDLGALGANLVAAGPLGPRVASAIPDFEVLVDRWDRQAPLAWDPTDRSAAADTVCLLRTDLARAITGKVLHVVGGMHAMAASLNEHPAGTRAAHH
jgi:enoyl-[acyl-carrier protein] reductase I